MTNAEYFFLSLSFLTVSMISNSYTSEIQKLKCAIVIKLCINLENYNIIDFLSTYAKHKNFNH